MLNLIPISDANPTRGVPFITIGLLAANIAAFFFLQPGFGQSPEASAYFYENAPIPCQLEESCPRAVRLGVAGPVQDIPERTLPSFLWATVVSTFLHAGFFHIAGNMLFLWVFGNNVEEFLGSVKFLLFYLLGGVVAAFAHVLTHFDSPIPTVGASGAVAAVMGAYMVLFPHARIRVLVFFFLITVVEMSAVVVLGLWFAYQFLIGAQEAAGGVEQVAWAAHVGGFVFGVIAIVVLGGRPHRRRRVWQPDWRY